MNGMWEKKSPEEIKVDIDRMFEVISEEILTDGYSRLMVSREMFYTIRAMLTFGQRVNRSNRHKFRRHYLSALQAY